MLPFDDVLAYLTEPGLPEACKVVLAEVMIHVYVKEGQHLPCHRVTHVWRA